MPARPMYYDFELINRKPIAKELGQRKLEEIHFVIFDTETTGLRTNKGDKII